jgi:hypothetical protein
LEMCRNEVRWPMANHGYMNMWKLLSLIFAAKLNKIQVKESSRELAPVFIHKAGGRSISYIPAILQFQIQKNSGNLFEIVKSWLKIWWFFGELYIPGTQVYLIAKDQPTLHY